jgi:2-oxoglutarate ferredoxin oxidoreductase subunit delta
MPRPVFNEKKCKACEMCIQACPKKILELSGTLNSKGYRVAHCIDEMTCIGCTLCAKMCPDAVIEIYK